MRSGGWFEFTLDTYDPKPFRLCREWASGLKPEPLVVLGGTMKSCFAKIARKDDS